MNIRVIRDAIRAHPFEPFTLRMNDGREFHVNHPELAMAGNRTVYVLQPESAVPVWIEPILIASIHFKTVKKNGKKKSDNGT